MASWSAKSCVVALTIPLVLPLVHDSWRLNFVVWSMPVLLTVLLVVVCVPTIGGVANAAPAVQRRWWPDWRDPLIWRLGLILGSVNTAYFVTNAFLPDYVTAAGRPDLVAPALTAINLAPVAGVVSDAGLCRTAGDTALGLCDHGIAVPRQRRSA